MDTVRKQGYIIPAVWGVFTFIVYFLATDNVSIADMIFRISLEMVRLYFRTAAI